MPYSICDCDVQVPFVLFIDFKEGHVLAKTVAGFFEGAVVQDGLSLPQHLEGLPVVWKFPVKSMCSHCIVILAKDLPYF